MRASFWPSAEMLAEAETDSLFDVRIVDFFSKFVMLGGDDEDSSNFSGDDAERLCFVEVTVESDLHSSFKDSRLAEVVCDFRSINQ